MNVSRAAAAAALTALCGFLAACGSIKSKVYDSDNYTSDERQVKCLQGIPETVDVPTHIKITVRESRYFKGPALTSDSSNTKATAISALDNMPLATEAQATAIQGAINTLVLKGVAASENEEKAGMATIMALEGEAAKLKKPDNQLQIDVLLKKIAELQIQIATTKDTSAADAATIARLKAELTAVKAQLAAENKYSLTGVHPTRSISYDIIKKKELFTVDFKRPASGTGDLKLAYGPPSGGQFFKSVGQDVTDTTITDVGALVSQIATVLPKLKAISEYDDAANKAQAKLGLHAVTTVVAVEYFDIHQPNLEGRIQEFLDRNVNACSPPCSDSNRPSPVAPFPSQHGTGPASAVVVPSGYRGTDAR